MNATNASSSSSSSSSSYKVNIANSDTLIVSFAGYAKIFGGIPMFEFVNFIETHFKHVSRHFYIDNHVNSYHQGIHEITNNIDETVNYLKNEITNYKNVIFLGVSSGGYAAILFGSLLNIKYVLAFIPQTIRRNKNANIDEKYRDIRGFINNTTKYYIYGDLSITEINHCHHISQCERISHHPNVTLVKKQHIDLKTMRNSGELYLSLNSLVNNSD
jgi:hypothetical protein